MPGPRIMQMLAIAFGKTYDADAVAFVDAAVNSPKASAARVLSELSVLVAKGYIKTADAIRVTNEAASQSEAARTKSEKKRRHE